jgi:DNA-binding transcriptional ArsR family regulator
MTEPLSDRLLDALGDPVARPVVRLLVEEELPQSDLIEKLGVAQATVSRAVKVLRAVGLVAPVDRGRGPRLAVTAPAEVVTLFLATDRLAEQVLEREEQAQKRRSKETRRLALRPAESQSKHK